MHVCLQGIYVLQDNNFRWLLRLAPASSLPDGSNRAEYLATVAQPYLELPCGLIRGEAAGAGSGTGFLGRGIGLEGMDRQLNRMSKGCTIEQVQGAAEQPALW
jgi:hypothetical protein